MADTTFTVKQNDPNFEKNMPRLAVYNPHPDVSLPVMVIKDQGKDSDGYTRYRMYPLDGGGIGYDINWSDAYDYQLTFVDSLTLVQG